MMDAYNEEKGGDTRVLFTEAYASIPDTVRYYEDENKRPRAHFPFNFILIEQIHDNSNAFDFKENIDSWLAAVPEGKASNWVVSRCSHMKLDYTEAFVMIAAWESRQAQICVALRNRKS